MAVAAVAIAWSAPVQAQRAADAPPSERIALAYAAPPGCPADDAFRAEVRSRATGDWEAKPGDLARRIAISVVLRGDRYLATIEFLNPQGEKVARSVAGKSCADVVNGIALVTALAIQSRVEEAMQRSDPEAPPSATPTAPAPTTSAPAAATVPAAPPAPPRETPPRPSAPADESPRHTRFRFGGAGVVATGVGPDPAFGPAFFTAIEWEEARLGVAGEAFWSGDVLASGVHARFWRMAARVEACPWSGGVGILSFEPAAFVEIGSLHGEGVEDQIIAKQDGGASLWVAPGATLRLVTSFEPVLVTLETAARVPVLRQKFRVVTPGEPEPLTAYSVPIAAFSAALGLGIRL